LGESFKTRCGKPQHDFTEGCYLFHEFERLMMNSL
jgi:hypothetical protein